MFKSKFGKKEQVKFNTVNAYYEFIGYLAKNDGSTRLVFENNDEQGAWGKEGRIEFLKSVPISLKAKLKHTAGTGNIESRVNCNEFLEHIISKHKFLTTNNQNLESIRKTIPINYLADFESGLTKVN
jgi:hypothetical protein